MTQRVNCTEYTDIMRKTGEKQDAKTIKTVWFDFFQYTYTREITWPNLSFLSYCLILDFSVLKK